MNTACKHDWKFCGHVGMKSWLSVSVLQEGCAKCGTVRQYLGDGHHKVLGNLVARPSNHPAFVIVSERTP